MSSDPRYPGSGPTESGPLAGFRRQGFLVVISGPSGVGKTSFCDHLLETRTDTVRSVSATTRAQRPGEIAGKDYTFVGRAEFDARRAAGEFLESAEVHGHQYGTPERFVLDAITRGRIVLLNIDVQGGLAIKARHPEGVYIFVQPPSIDSLRARLVARQQDGATEIERRLGNAPGEMRRWREYDYVVVNEDLPTALSQVSAIVEAERARVGRFRASSPTGATAAPSV
jgi:guanylate kinase